MRQGRRKCTARATHAAGAGRGRGQVRTSPIVQHAPRGGRHAYSETLVMFCSKELWYVRMAPSTFPYPWPRERGVRLRAHTARFRHPAAGAYLLHVGHLVLAPGRLLRRLGLHAAQLRRGLVRFLEVLRPPRLQRLSLLLRAPQRRARGCNVQVCPALQVGEPLVRARDLPLRVLQGSRQRQRQRSSPGRQGNSTEP